MRKLKWFGWPDKPATPCANGCVGPFTPRPDMDAWLKRLAADAGRPISEVLPQYDCAACGTTRGFTVEELKGAA